MSEESEQQEAPVINYPEAPYSFNVKAVSPGGFDVMLTIRGVESTNFLERVERTLAWLPAKQYRPTFVPTLGVAPAQTAPVPPAVANAQSVAPPMCTVHNRQMRASSFEGGGWHCTAVVGQHPQTGERMYCNQKVPA